MKLRCLESDSEIQAVRIADLEARLTRTIWEEFVESLVPDKYRNNRHELGLDGQVKNSCLWFFAGEDFRRWERHHNPGVLLVHGECITP